MSISINYHHINCKRFPSQLTALLKVITEYIYIKVSRYCSCQDSEFRSAMETSSVDIDKLLSKNFFLWIQCPKISLLLFKDGAYTEALKKNGYNTNLQFDKTCTNKSNEKNKTRKRNITWFNPPFNINVATNVAKTFLS